MKLKNIPKKQKMVTKNIPLTESQNKTVEDYYRYLESVTDQGIITSEVLPEIIMQFIKTDTEFKKFIKQRSQKNTAATQSPAEQIT